MLNRLKNIRLYRKPKIQKKQNLPPIVNANGSISSDIQRIKNNPMQNGQMLQEKYLNIKNKVKNVVIYRGFDPKQEMAKLEVLYERVKASNGIVKDNVFNEIDKKMNSLFADVSDKIKARFLIDNFSDNINKLQEDLSRLSMKFSDDKNNEVFSKGVKHVKNIIQQSEKIAKVKGNGSVEEERERMRNVLLFSKKIENCHVKLGGLRGVNKGNREIVKNRIAEINVKINKIKTKYPDEYYNFSLNVNKSNNSVNRRIANFSSGYHLGSSISNDKEKLIELKEKNIDNEYLYINENKKNNILSDLEEINQRVNEKEALIKEEIEKFNQTVKNDLLNIEKSDYQGYVSHSECKNIFNNINAINKVKDEMRRKFDNADDPLTHSERHTYLTDIAKNEASILTDIERIKKDIRAEIKNIYREVSIIIGEDEARYFSKEKEDVTLLINALNCHQNQPGKLCKPFFDGCLENMKNVKNGVKEKILNIGKNHSYKIEILKQVNNLEEYIYPDKEKHFKEEIKLLNEVKGESRGEGLDKYNDRPDNELVDEYNNDLKKMAAIKENVKNKLTVKINNLPVRIDNKDEFSKEKEALDKIKSGLEGGSIEGYYENSEEVNKVESRVNDKLSLIASFETMIDKIIGQDKKRKSYHRKLTEEKLEKLNQIKGALGIIIGQVVDFQHEKLGGTDKQILFDRIVSAKISITIAGKSCCFFCHGNDSNEESTSLSNVINGKTAKAKFWGRTRSAHALNDYLSDGGEKLKGNGFDFQGCELKEQSELDNLDLKCN